MSDTETLEKVKEHVIQCAQIAWAAGNKSDARIYEEILAIMGLKNSRKEKKEKSIDDRMAAVKENLREYTSYPLAGGEHPSKKGAEIDLLFSIVALLDELVRRENERK